MPNVAFGLQVPPGKAAEVEHFVKELLGDKHSHFHDNRKGRVDRITVFHQKWPTEQYVVYMEAKDLVEAMRGHDQSHDFEAWFAKRWEEITGHHPDKIDHEIATVVMDWHHQKGGARKHHH